MQLDRPLGLTDIVEPTALRDVCAAFQELFGIGLRVFAADGALLAEAPTEEPFCDYVRGFREGRRQCSQLRAQLARYSGAESDALVVRCFAGCRYFTVPVVFEGDLLGKVVYGPYVPADAGPLPPALLRLDPQVDPAALVERADRMRHVQPETVERIARTFGRVLDLILAGGQRAALTSETHLAAIQESYREITEKNRLLEQTTERMRELDHLKSNFLATVSHELRTPLTSIIGYSEMLAQGLSGPLSEEQNKFVATILEKSEHLLTLISAVLDISTLDAGRLALHREPTDLAGLCARAVELVQGQSGRHDVRIVQRAAAHVPPVPVDPELITKALVHLIDNAVKFSPPSSTVDIELSVLEPRPDGGESVGFVLLAPLRRFVQIAVRDAGPGIPEDNIERIFEAFFQVDGSATRTHGGLGLGLALVRQFARAHGGEITVESPPGQGSIFRLSLPVPPSGSIPPRADA